MLGILFILIFFSLVFCQSCSLVLGFVYFSGVGRKQEIRLEWKVFLNFIYNCYSDKKQFGKKKNVSFFLSFKKEQIEVIGGLFYNRYFY